MTRYLETRYDNAPSEEQAAFDRLLDYQDPDILRYLFKKEFPEDKDVARLIETLATLNTASA